MSSAPIPLCIIYRDQRAPPVLSSSCTHICVMMRPSRTPTYRPTSPIPSAADFLTFALRPRYKRIPKRCIPYVFYFWVYHDQEFSRATRTRMYPPDSGSPRNAVSSSFFFSTLSTQRYLFYDKDDDEEEEERFYYGCNEGKKDVFWMKTSSRNRRDEILCSVFF